MTARTFGNGAPTWSRLSPVRSTFSLHTHRLTSPADDFFVGIGDINSAFLPKIAPLAPPVDPPPPPPVTAAETSPEGKAPAADADAEEDDDDDEDLEDDMEESLDSQPSPVEEESLTEIQKNEILTRNTEALEAQVEERPLAKKQEELQETAAEDAAAAAAAQPAPEAAPATTNGDGAQPPVEQKPKFPRKALLTNNDKELARVKQVRIDAVLPYAACLMSRSVDLGACPRTLLHRLGEA